MSELAVRELTAQGRGGVSVLELRGPAALARVRSLCPAATLEPGGPCLVRLGPVGARLDEALVAVFAEDLVELHLHGSPAVVESVLSGLGPLDCSGVSLTLEQRAEALLPGAPSEGGARILLDQVEGALRRELERIMAAPPPEQERSLDLLIDRAAAVQRTLRPALVLLLGPVNAGKSTLLNALVGSERVLVSAEVGTTRDVVLERARLGAYPVDLVDAPGVPDGRAAAARRGTELEREGRRLAHELLDRADLILWLTAPAQALEPPAGLPRQHTVRLTTQADRLPPGAPIASAGALRALGDPAAAAATVARVFRTHLGLPIDPWSPGAPAAFEPDQVQRLRVARAAAPGTRTALLAGLLGHPAPGMAGRS